jgi:hypothetical protein
VFTHCQFYAVALVFLKRDVVGLATRSNAMMEGVLGQDIESEARQEIQAKVKEALNGARDAIWADYRFVMIAGQALWARPSGHHE